MIDPTDLLHPSPAPHFKTFQEFLIYWPKRPSFSTVQIYAPNVTKFFLKFKPSVPANRVFFLLNAAFAMATLYLISQVHLPLFVNMLKHNLILKIFKLVI